jgi:uncharacterized membrane protein YccC
VWKGGWLAHSARTAIAAGASLVCGRLLRLPEAYWAPITTIVVMQSTLGASLDVSKKRFLGTALGAAAGGLLATYFAPRVVTFAAAIFALGLICAVLRQDQTAYRFGGITLAIVMLVGRTSPPFVIAAHRFAEVSLGILVALVLTAVWPGREQAPGS